MKKGKVTSEIGYKVTERAGCSCEYCGRITYNGEIHHIVGRSVDATEENLIFLCVQCHRGENGMHGRDGHKHQLSIRLKLQEKYFSQGKTEDEVRKLMGGRIYLPEE